MTPGEWRANVAGYIDAAGSLLREVEDVTREAGVQKRANVPDAVLNQIAEARRIMAQLSEWYVSPHNSSLERGNG